MYARITLTFLMLASMTGCTSIMSIGESEYTCKGMPNGATCMSAKDVYSATEGDDYKTQLKKEQEGSNTDPSDSKEGPQVTRVLYPEGADNAPIPMRARNPLPIRTQAVVMRIAVDPWEDENGDLNIPGFIYTEIEPRRWEIGARQPNAAPTLRPLSIKPAN
ncbi:type IV conjugative transfer system lipoprotein TraV [Aquipseudomonas alcaligenes]|uniref:Conjugal transfer pilus assembly protein TraV n=1 Tax=Aquipseudomonas alcaligenes TaxID=43263 RepID=A0A1N6XE66_AQUAC|nr:type IV conjugative transfer system lipoprotein TraV [Pseudomonas alcaligenes]SIR00652.1 conjugal transfer pilus assembly protein TraV [Pseudomonas alcaligenes]